MGRSLTSVKNAPTGNYVCRYHEFLLIRITEESLESLLEIANEYYVCNYLQFYSAIIGNSEHRVINLLLCVSCSSSQEFYC